MVEYARLASELSSLSAVAVSEDDSVYPTSSLSCRSDLSSDVISLYDPASSALSISFDECLIGGTTQGCLTRSTNPLEDSNFFQRSAPSVRITSPFHRTIQIPSPVDGENIDNDDLETSHTYDKNSQNSESHQISFSEINDARYSLSDFFAKEYEGVPQSSINTEPICSESCEESRVLSLKLSELQRNENDKKRSVSDKKFFCCSTQPSNTVQAQSTSVATSGRTGESYKATVSLPSPGLRDTQTLYRSSVRNFNPSGCGERAYQEFMELTDWANKCLSYGIVKLQINDLASELGDGLTLLDLVEVLTDESPPQLHIKPALMVQKIENIQACLEFLKEKGVNTDGISSEDLVKGNMKVVLALCNSLKRAFTAPIGFPNKTKDEAFYEEMSVRNSQNKDNNIKQSANIQQTLFTPIMSHARDSEAAQLRSVDHCKIDKQQRETKSRDHSGSPVDLQRGDALLLQWVAKVTGQTVRDYSDFQTGDLLCYLVNIAANGAVPARVMKSGSPSEKVNFALQVCREEIGLNCGLQTEDVVPSCNSFKLSSFLKQLRKIFTHRREAETIHNSTPITKTGPNGQLTMYGDKSQGTSESKRSGVVSSNSQRQLEKELELKAKIDFYEKERLILEETLRQVQVDRSANDTSKLDFNGIYTDRPVARIQFLNSPCNYLDKTSGTIAKSCGYNSAVKSDDALRVNGQNISEVLSPEEDSWKNSYLRETEPPVFLFQRPTVPERHNTSFEETSVFGPSDKWKTPSSQELKTCQSKTEQFSRETKSARQRLREIKRNLELLKLMYLCHSENDNNTRAESRVTPRLLKATRNLDNNSLLLQGLSQSRSPVDIAPNTGPKYTRLNANGMAFEGNTQIPYDPITATIEYDDVLNMTYPQVMPKVHRPRSADILSNRRPHSAEPRPKSASSVVSNLSSSAYYRKSPDVLNRITTHRNDVVGFPVSGYIEASGSQLFLPRSRPLGINDPVSTRSIKKVSLQQNCSSPIARKSFKGSTPILSTTKKLSESAEDVEVLHIGDSFMISESSETEHDETNSEGSRPFSRASSDEAGTSINTVNGNESRVTQPPKLNTLTALIRMTAKKASG